MIQIPDRNGQPSGREPDALDALCWGADDLAAITYFVSNYAYIAAEETIHVLYKTLDLKDHELGPTLNKVIGNLADKIAEGMVEFYRAKLAESERAGTWEPERVVLERMRGNPEARPAPPAAR